MYSTPVFLNGRTIGQVNPDGTFQKRVKNRHFLKSPRAIAYDTETLEQARKAGAQSLLVISEDETRYSVDLATFENKSFSLNRGWGQQRALRLEFWHKTRPGEPQVNQLALSL